MVWRHRVEQLTAALITARQGRYALLYAQAAWLYVGGLWTAAVMTVGQTITSWQR